MQLLSGLQYFSDDGCFGFCIIFLLATECLKHYVFLTCWMFTMQMGSIRRWGFFWESICRWWYHQFITVAPRCFSIWS